MVRAQILRWGAAAVIFTALPGVSCFGTGNPGPPKFDRDHAFGYLERQVSFGPRVPGTEAHEKTADWLVSVLRDYTSQVTVQPFNGTFGGTEASMKNILASFYPGTMKRVLLCAHWDSRHHADRDPDPAHHDMPVPGANDGASGVAVLLEIAGCLAGQEPPVGVDIVLFDGEDGGRYRDDASWLLGSRHFASVMPQNFRPEYALLLDMVGDSDLVLSSDFSSIKSAPRVWERIVRHCKALHIPIDSEPVGILDDHVPLIGRGIPSVDIIDFTYLFWHTVSDTPDKCSPESLGKIGELVLRLLYEER